MALNLELTRGKGPDAFDQSLLNFNSINQVPGGNDLITALKGHDMYSFFQILQNDFGIELDDCFVFSGKVKQHREWGANDQIPQTVWNYVKLVENVGSISK